MVKLKLNENYSNDFLTTMRGEAFFKDWQEQNRPEWVEIDDDAFEKDIELKKLVSQGTLIVKKEKKKEANKEVKKEVKKEAKKEAKK